MVYLHNGINLLQIVFKVQKHSEKRNYNIKNKTTVAWYIIKYI